MRYDLHDALGSVIAQVSLDEDEPQVVWAAQYDAYGKKLAESSETPNPYRWGGAHGYYADEDVGMYLMGYRWYDSFTGRFISRDPIGFAAGDMNQYRPMGNNPVNAVDPQGTWWHWVAIGVGAVGAFGYYGWKATRPEKSSAPLHWIVKEKTIDLSPQRGNELSQAAIDFGNPRGFEVIYSPPAGACPNGQIVLYQIVSSVGLSGRTAHLDRGRAAATDLPNEMKPYGSQGALSYEDSPSGEGISKYRFTAVAVCRAGGGDVVLSTFYFEFDPKTRKLDLSPDPFQTGHYERGIR